MQIRGANLLQVPISQVIERIQQETGLSFDEVKGQIAAKITKLEGLVSEEGAAYIVASELGVQLFKNADSKSPLKIKDLIAGMRSVEVFGKVTRVFPPKQFKTKDNRQGEVGSVVIADETGTTRAVLWDKKTSLIKDDKLKTGTIVRIRDAQVKQNNLGNIELHVGSRSSVIVDPKGVMIVTKSAISAKKTAIRDIKAGETVSILGTVVQLFPPKFYPVCPKCGKKVTIAPEGAICSEHKSVTAAQAMILNFVLDDCTDTLRVVAFKQAAENLCGMTSQEIQDVNAKDGPEILQERIDHFLLGRTILAEGRVKENINFERTELVISNVNLNPNPKELSDHILAGGKHA